MGSFSPRHVGEGAARRPGSLAGLLVAGLLAGPLMGCADDGVEQSSCAYAVCSTDEQDCIKRVAEVVGCHLDREVLYPTVRLLTAEQILAEIEGSAPPLTAEQERDNHDYLRMQVLLGLMPEGYSPAQANADSLRNFAAFYSPEHKDIVIIADRASRDLESDYSVLIHEMVHAYQDAAWDLTALQKVHAYTYDRSLGVRALIEGDAVLYQSLAAVELAGNDPLEVDWWGYFNDWQVDSLKHASETQTPALDTGARFPYAFGGEFVLNAWQDGGTSRIEDLWSSPPDSVRQVFGGYDSWPEQFSNGDLLFDPRAVAVMPPNYALVGGGHEGIWSINAMLQRTAGGGRWSSEIEDISADYLASWRWNDSDVVAMWRIRSAQPFELLNALRAVGSRWVAVDITDLPTTHLVTMIDSDLVLIAVTSGDARTVLAEIEGWQSPAEAYPAPDAGAVRNTLVLDPRRLGCAPPREARAGI